MTIYKKMANILWECEAILKDRTNTHQGFKFRGIDDAMNTLHDTFASNGVFLLHEILEHSVTERTTAKGGINFHHLAKVKFHFCADDGTSVAAIGIGEAADTGDKGAGKAMSYALKVCLLQTFLIPTEEDKDPDAHCHSFQRPAPVAPAPKPVPVATPKTDKISADLARELGTPAETVAAMKFSREDSKQVQAVKTALAKAKIPNETIKKHKEDFEAYLFDATYFSFDEAVINFFSERK
jgi:hypothetical protein